MKNNNYNGSIEYEKAMRFLELGCNCGCSKKIPREKFAELREAFQALSRSEQDIFLMAQLKAMDGGKISTSRCLKRKRALIRELLLLRSPYASVSENLSQYVRNRSRKR